MLTREENSPNFTVKMVVLKCLKIILPEKEKHILYIGGTPYESNIVYLKNFTGATIGNGALAGGGSGGVVSLINGDNFLEGPAKGAVIGGRCSCKVESRYHP